MPDAAAECGDVDLVFVLRVWNHAVDPFEVESWNSFPAFATVGGAPDRGLISSGIQDFRMFWIKRHVVQVLVAGPTSFPGCSGVVGDVDTPDLGLMRKVAPPGCKIEALRIVRIHRQPAWPVDAGRKSDSRPVFSSVRRAIEGAVFVVAEVAVGAAAGDD